jgi:glutathione-regulated potassium-efflux system ancillary protein KefG
MDRLRSASQVSDKPTILVLFAHLAIQHSKINRAMVEAIRGIEHVIFHDLLETYPDFYIDVKQEQRLLAKADLIVFHHPIYWYSTPAIFKHWQDVVLTRGFAYGEGGTALYGKDFMQAISAGALPEAYQADGIHRYNLEEFLKPFKQTATFCGMNYLPPMVIQGGHSLPDEVIREHARRFRKFLEDYGPSRHVSSTRSE